MSDNYDKLSELGVRQSQLLGDYLVRHAVHFDRAYTGPRLRHRETADAVKAAYAEADIGFPELVELPGLDEFQWDGLLRHVLEDENFLPEAAQTEWHGYHNAENTTQKRRHFQRFMEHVTTMWVNGETDPKEVEPWEDFRVRVNEAIDTMIAGGKSGERVIAFTSGGPSAASVQRALNLDGKTALELIWTLRNAAIVDFLYTKDRFSLSSFNEAPHLDDRSLWTYR
jgi:broad specificity phosphatase PhoE